MVRKLGICFLLLFCTLQAYPIEAVVSHSVFYIANQGGKLVPSVEMYWQVNPKKLHYTTTPEKTIIARIKTDILLTNETGVVKEDHFILETVPRNNVAELGKQNIIDLHRYFITTGTIKMKLTLTDLADSTHHFIYKDSFVVTPAANIPFYSDPQLLDTTLPSTAQTIFYKNEQQQVPACTNFLDDGKNILHYYAELYNGSQLFKAPRPLVQKVYIVKKETDNPTGYFVKTDTIMPQDISLVSGSFNISSLQSGNYYLCVKLEDSSHTLVASGNLFFQRLNTHPAPEDTSKKGVAVSDTGIEDVTVLDLSKTFIAKYSLAEIRAIMKMMLPVSDAAGTKTINGFLKKPDELYMRYYIYNYFSYIYKKDPGKAWKEYTTKVKEVNKLFTSRGVAGYETDRGFIYLRYGPPTEMITVENEPGTVPYEVWQYNVLTETTHKDVANAVFLFYKQDQMTSEYKLLHSTVTGEMRNQTWRNYLYTGGQGGTNINSRAEQYIGNR